MEAIIVLALFMGALLVTLQGCGGGGTRGPNPTGKLPIYVILRMDDIQLSWHADVQKSVVEWAVNNEVKLNVGIVSGPDGSGQVWPTTCAAHPTDRGCDDMAVSAIYDAYSNGHVLGHRVKGANPIIEIYDHAWDHNGWPTLSAVEQEADMERSTTALRTAYPEASLRTFVPPENIATAGSIAAVKKNGVDILSSQGTIGCGNGTGTAPRYNYVYAPCQDDGDHYCIPPGDVYVSSDGFQKVTEGIFSVPTGSANSLFSNVNKGLSVADTLGVDACGCVGDICGIIAAARNNAKKSSGLHWTVLMMHPQTVFPGQDYTGWLDDLLATSRTLDHYDVHFIHFQDLVTFHEPSVGTLVA